MTGLSRDFLSGASLSGARLLSGIVRVKTIALALGVGGVGIFSMVSQIQLTGIALVSLSLAVPMINLGRRHVVEDDMRAAGEVVGTCILLLAVSAIIMLGVWVLAAPKLADLLSVDSPDQLHIWPIPVAVLLSALASGIWEGLAFVAQRFDLYVKVGIAAAVCEALIVSLAAHTFGLQGAIYALPFGSAALLLSYVFIVGREKNVVRLIRSASINLRLAPQILGYSVTMLLSVALTALVLASLRGLVLTAAGAQANGELQVATTFATYLLAFITTGFWGHLHARAAAEGASVEVVGSLNQYLLLCTRLIFLACGLLVTLAPIGIRILYSSEFLAADGILTPYLAGDYFFQVSTIMISFLLAVGYRRKYIAANLAYLAILAIAAWVLIPQWAALGYVSAHILASLILMLFLSIIFIQERLVTRATLLAIYGSGVGLALLCYAVKVMRDDPRLLLWSYLLALVPLLYGVRALKQLWDQR